MSEMRLHTIYAICFALIANIAICGETEKSADRSAIIKLSLQQLLELEVTSVSKTAQPVNESAAAIYVITGEDIRRSGVTSIAESLKLAPGMNVLRLDKHRWSIGSRGFGGLFANKLLVLIDGRSVYTPLFSGVYWDVQDTFMEDIDRIEVVRGPGATLWGSNAVNGVINVVTKSAKETQGGLLVAGTGNEERGFGRIRYGGTPKKDLHIRGYVNYFDRDPSVTANGRTGVDDVQMGRGGFRMDWNPAPEHAVTFQGDLYKGSEGQRFSLTQLTPPFSSTEVSDVEVAGGNLLGRWALSHGEDSNSTLQMYYDVTSRETPVLQEVRHTFDLDFQHAMSLGSRHKLILGAGYRVTADNTDGTFNTSFTPDERTLQLPSAFLQDTVSVIEDKLDVIFGSKFEYTDYTGLEIQPSARAVFHPHQNHTLWTAVSRAVRTPARVNDDFNHNPAVLPPGSLGPGSPAAAINVLGNKDFKSEELLACELGYRVRPHRRVSLDLTGFVNFYDQLSTNESEAPINRTTPTPHIALPSLSRNLVHGNSYGFEAVIEAQPLDRWRLSASYSFLDIQLHTRRRSSESRADSTAENSPPHQFQIRSMLDLPKNVQLDLGVRYVDTHPRGNQESFWQVDARVGWRPIERLDVSLIGQNLIDDRHPESPNAPFEAQRSVYLRVTLKF